MQHQTEIQLALPRDAEEIARMSKTQIEYGLPWTWTPARVARAMRHPATNVIVARENTQLVGFGIMRYADTLAHLNLLAVQDSHRRTRLGSALYLWLEEVARAAGIAIVHVQARTENMAARAFYRRHGYVETALVPGMYHRMAHGVRLEKSLITRAAPAGSGSP